MNYVGFEVLTAVVMNRSIFCDVTPCSSVKVSRRIGGYVASIFGVEE
jgi:hypothetical protein